MTDLYLRFADESESLPLLFTADDPPTKVYTLTDIIGTIYRATGDVDAEGNPVEAPLPGWHVNVRLLDSEDGAPLAPFTINPLPVNPVRVWA